MSFLVHFMKDERIAALHITEDAVSVLSFVRTTKRLHESHIVRIPLAEGTIVEGRVVDVVALTRTLRDLRLKGKTHAHVIAAIPHPAIFTKTVTLPDMHDEVRTLEAANLALEWNIPFAHEERYADVDILEDPIPSMHMQAVATKDALPYMHALERSGFKLVALESEHSAIARTLSPSDYVVTSWISPSYENILATHDGHAIFSSVVAKDSFPTKTARTNALKRTSEFVASLFKKRPTVKLFEKLPLLEEAQSIVDARNDTSLIPLLGTALRARTARRDDVAASLLPVGTEEAYEFQKLEAFVSTLGTFTLVIALLIASAATTAWYIVQTQLTILPRNDVFAETFSLDASFATERAHYDRFSAVVNTLAPLAIEEISFAESAEFLRRYAIAGIALRDVEATAASIRIGGVARSRTHLNTFRDAMKAAPEVAAVELPITDAELRGDIPFTMTITFKSATTWQTWRAQTE